MIRLDKPKGHPEGWPPELAEAVGFEPTGALFDGSPRTVFETAALSRSATLPSVAQRPRLTAGAFEYLTLSSTRADDALWIRLHIGKEMLLPAIL